MNTAELAFEQPRDLFGAEPPEFKAGSRDAVRLLVTTPSEHRHAMFSDLAQFLDAGDLLVVNVSATLPASLLADGPLGPFTLNLSTRYGERLWLAEPRWDPGHPGPMPIEAGAEVRVGPATIRFVAPYPGIPRLWFVHTDRPLEPILASQGSPIHYGYVGQTWPLDAYQSIFSRIPGSVEMPSAARPITPRIREVLEAAGVRLASILLHAGVSSLEIETRTVEEQAVYPEPFEVSPATAAAVNEVHRQSHRVIAVGTTVARALESAWTPVGVVPMRGFTRLFINTDHPPRAVDGLLTGFHDPATSHLAMLSAFIGIDRVRDAYREAVSNRYRWHEFGDSHLVLRN